jgi:PAS domain S-box-containing protein
VADARTWRFTYVGPQAVKLLGFPIEAWLKEGFWVDRIHPEDRERVIDFCRRSSESLKDYEFEYRMLCRDGKVVWIHDIVSVESRDGAPVKLRGFMIDISERKWAEEAVAASEAQLRLIADSLPVLISYIDSEQRYRFNNMEYERVHGLSRQELLGRTVREINGEEVYRKIRPKLEQALTGHHVRYEASFPLPEGSLEHYQVTYVPHVDREGRAQGCYVLAQDVTERVRSEEQRRGHQEQLAHVSRVAMMGELATGLAHEINQPLCAIISNAQSGQRFLLGDLFDRQEIREVLSDIIADGRRASDVIQKLRTFLKRGDLERKPLDINEVCREVIDLVRRDAVEHHVDIRLELESSVPPVEGDRIQLQQVLLNLILNGFEALASVEPESRHLTITTSCPAPRVVAVAVEDSGPGFLDEDVNNVFEPFVTSKPNGLGMGLSISRTIIESHAGRLWATRNADRGATFQFTLPSSAGKADGAEGADPEPSGEAGTPSAERTASSPEDTPAS